MGIISSLRSRQISAASIGRSYHPKDPALVEYFGGRRTAAGQHVTSENAMRVSAVYAAVKRKTDGVSMVPLQLLRRLSQGREQARDLSLYQLLHNQPNRWQTSQEFREMMQAHVELRGNAYALKVINRSGFIEELIPMDPDRMRPFWVNRRRGVIAYRYTHPDTGTEQTYLQSDIFHIRGLSTNGGLSGLNPIEYHRETIGHTMAAQEYSSRFYANDATPPIWLEHPSHFKDKIKREEFRQNFGEQTRGENRHAPVVLEDNIKVHQLSINQRDAQYIEGRKFGVSDIARIFQVPPHMIGDLERATFSNITQMSLEFVIYTLMPQYTRWEQVVWRDLFMTTEERDTLFIKFVVDGLLRGDIKTRYEAYRMGILDGHMSRNEARELEDRNPEEGLDDFLFPANMNVEGEGPQDDSRGARMTDAAAKRVVAKEYKAIRKAFDKIQDTGERRAWVEAFYAEHAGFVADVMSVETSEAQEYCERAAQKWADFIDIYGDISGRFEQVQYHQLHVTAALAAE